MRTKVALFSFAIGLATLVSVHGAFADQFGITPTPTPHTDTDTSLTRTTDLSLPSAGVTDTGYSSDANGGTGSDLGSGGTSGNTGDSSNSSDSSANNDPKAPQNDPCYNVTVSPQSNGGTPQQMYTEQPDSGCETWWKKSNYNKQAFCKIDGDQAGDISYVEDSGAKVNIGDRCKQSLGSPSIVATQAIAQSIINNIDPTTSAGQQQLAQALQNLGVSQQDALAAVQSNPGQVQSLLADVAQGNSSGAQSIGQSLNLNQDVLNNISQLQPNGLPGVLNGVASQNQLTNMTDALNTPNDASTFNSGQPAPSTGQPASEPWNNLPVQCGTPGIAGNMMLNESGCGANTNNPINPNVHGPLQYLCSTWTSYANTSGNSQYADCSYANNPQIAAQVTNAYYEQIEPQIQPQCDAAGVSATACIYTYHWLGAGGFNQLMNALPNVDQTASANSLCGSAISSAACSGNPGFFGSKSQSYTIAGMFQNMDTNLLGGGGQITGLAANAGTGAVTSNIGPIGSATNFNGGTANPGSGLIGVSPLSTASFIPSASQGGGGGPVSSNGSNFSNSSNSSLNSLLPLMLMKSVLGGLTSQSTTPPPPPPPPVQTTSATQTTAPSTQTQTSGTTQTTSVTPTDSITAQPAIVVPGNQISLTWSSAGVSTNPPCQITKNGTGIAQGNTGSITIPTNSSTATGRMTFAISCTPSSGGQALQQSSSVIIN